MLRWMTNLIGVKENNQGVPKLSLSKLSSLVDYKRHLNENLPNDIASLSFEINLLPETQTEFFFNGYCKVCEKFVDFLVDFNYSYEVNGVLMPNWRERLECPNCRLNNRMRATVHVFNQEFLPNFDSKIYITEQTTPLYNWFIENFSDVYGSEFLGDSVPNGSCNENGIRNEDLTKLSFPDDTFNYILSFDVFEHIPNYKKALRQCFRCLKPNAVFYFSVPFTKTKENNTVRATVSENGDIEHILPPQYHGDPINSDGCLCFYCFGWEILNVLKEIGFIDVNALSYWSPDYGYLGGEQILFTAKKPPLIDRC